MNTNSVWYKNPEYSGTGGDPTQYREINQQEVDNMKEKIESKVDSETIQKILEENWHPDYFDVEVEGNAINYYSVTITSFASEVEYDIDSHEVTMEVFTKKGIEVNPVYSLKTAFTPLYSVEDGDPIVRAGKFCSMLELSIVKSLNNNLKLEGLVQ